MTDLAGLAPGLLVAVPMLAATLPLALGLRFERVGWPIAAVTLAIEALLAAVLAAAVFVDGRRVVHVPGGETFGRREEQLASGDATEGFAVGIELVADALSVVVVLLVAGVALATLAFARRAGPRGNAFYSGYLLLTGGLMGLSLTGDLFNLFVFLEIVGLAAYALVASDRSAASAVAALKYLLIGTVGASLYLVGVGYIYLSTGALNMVDVSRTLAGEVPWAETMYGDTMVIAAFGFIAVGLLTKVAIYPLHTWQPDAYATAPDSVTVYIAALVSTSAAYALARITWNVFTPRFFDATVGAELALNGVLALAALSVLVASVLAAVQPRIKRVFAYSSVAQFGLIVLGIGMAVHPVSGETATTFAVYGVVIHLAAHALLKGGLFATAGALAQGTGARTLQEYAGLAKRRPLLAGAMATLGFGIVGVPPTVGFIGKWYLAVASVESGLWPVVLVIFASTLLTLLYVARILERLYFSPAAESAPARSGGLVTDGGRGLTLGMVGLAVGAAVASFALGLGGGVLTDAVDPVAEAVIENAPEVGGNE